MSKLVFFFLDLGERAVKTFVQQFAVVLLATGSAGLSGFELYGRAADSAAFAAVASLVLSVAMVKVTLSGWPDLAARTVRTFIASVGGSLAAGAGDSFVHADWRAAIAVAVPTTVLSFVMGLAAMANPNLIGSSVIPMPTRDPGNAAALGPVTTAMIAQAGAQRVPEHVVAWPASAEDLPVEPDTPPPNTGSAVGTFGVGKTLPPGVTIDEAG